jgi:hypothetical protein
MQILRSYELTEGEKMKKGNCHYQFPLNLVNPHSAISSQQ